MEVPLGESPSLFWFLFFVNGVSDDLPFLDEDTTDDIVADVEISDYENETDTDA
jgi:hypothetical protein